ncbi:methylmalonyl-CoA mutase subunit beta [Leptobacterium sp. I13]|uniref:methylmalonyl-CoA mutase subunit beta n=1 Tax=Leptobacterium meishanense TaxID=3128904 RepID=UPI0030EF4C3D
MNKYFETLSFDEFDNISAKQWKQKIQVDLKGADYNKTMVWNTLEGIDVKPFYTTEDIEKVKIQNSAPPNWKICQKIYVANTKKSNEKARDAIQRGTESIAFVIPTKEISIEKLFGGIDLNKIPVHLQMQFLDSGFIKNLKNYLEDKNAEIHLHIDIIGNLARTGNWFHNLDKDHEVLSDILQYSNTFETILSVDASLYQNAGANNTQQLAYAMAHANEYLNFVNNVISNDPTTAGSEKSVKINFNIAIGANYFFEIAKIRALRLLWNTIASEYGITHDCHIFAQPSERNKTLYDYNVNMLRTTTESMSAILGGTDTICNLPYDNIYHKDNEFAERISRNQLLILKNESYFDKTTNPADGSYYIESITQQLAEKALRIFKQIEVGGGFLKQLKEHTIQRKIKEQATAEQTLYDTEKQILVGTNKYVNEQDKMKSELELYPFVKTDSRKTLIEPILEQRLAEQIEQKRLENEA